MAQALNMAPGAHEPGCPHGIGDDHALLCRAVREAGAIATAYFGKGVTGWDKRPGEPVSAADLAVDAFLRDTLMGARPDYGWLSEESAESENRLTAARVWVVDPIDGTRAFLRGRPEYAVSVALVADGRPLAGAVFNPERDEFFEAVAGGGARLNGVPITVSSQHDIATMKLVVSRHEFAALNRRGAFAQCEAQPVSSIAYKIALVAAGRADAVIALLPKSDWDIAAAHLIATEAGARITGTDGVEILYNHAQPRHDSVLAANPRLHGLLKAHLAKI